MGYGKKNTDKNELHILERIKEVEKIVVGESYHLRKMLRQEGNTVFDEVHDVKVSKFENGIITDEETGETFNFSEFEVFKRK